MSLEEELLRASQYYVPKILKMCLEAGVDVNYENGLLMRSVCAHGDKELVDLLIDYGFDRQRYGYQGLIGCERSHKLLDYVLSWDLSFAEMSKYEKKAAYCFLYHPTHKE